MSMYSILHPQQNRRGLENNDDVISNAWQLSIYYKMGLLNYICNLPDDTVKTRLKSNIVAAKGAFVLFLDILIVILIV